MADVALVLVALVFFGVCATYVRALDRMVASTEEPDDPAEAVR